MRKQISYVEGLPSEKRRRKERKERSIQKNPTIAAKESDITVKEEGTQEKKPHASSPELNISITESFLETCEFEYVAEERPHEENMEEKMEDGNKMNENSSKIEGKEDEKNMPLVLGLQPGSIFKSFNDFETVFQKYCEVTFTNVRKEKSWATSSKNCLAFMNFPINGYITSV